jgi:hypothetical protein
MAFFDEQEEFYDYEGGREDSGWSLPQILLTSVVFLFGGAAWYGIGLISSTDTSTEIYSATQTGVFVSIEGTNAQAAQNVAMATFDQIKAANTVQAQQTQNAVATVNKVVEEILAVTQRAAEASYTTTPSAMPTFTNTPLPSPISSPIPSSTFAPSPTAVPASNLRYNVDECISNLNVKSGLSLTGDNSLSTWISSWPNEAVSNPPLTDMEGIENFFTYGNSPTTAFIPNFMTKYNAPDYNGLFPQGINTPIKDLLNDKSINLEICRFSDYFEVPSSEMASSSIDTVSQAPSSHNFSIELTQDSAFLMVLAGVTAYEYVIKPGVRLARENDLREVPGLLVQEYGRNIRQGAQNFVNQVRYMGNSAEFAFYAAKGAVKNLIPRSNGSTGTTGDRVKTYGALP